MHIANDRKNCVTMHNNFVLQNMDVLQTVCCYLDLPSLVALASVDKTTRCTIMDMHTCLCTAVPYWPSIPLWSQLSQPFQQWIQRIELQQRILDTLSPACIAWSHRGDRIAVGDFYTWIHIYSVETGCKLTSLGCHAADVNALFWSPDNSKIVSGSSDWTLRIWDVEMGICLQVLHYIPMARMITVSWSPDGTRIVSGSSDQIVRIWDATTGHVLHHLHGHTDHVHCVAWSPDSTKVVSGSQDKTVRVWDATIGNSILSFPPNRDGGITTVKWSSDGTKVLSVTEGGNICIRNARTGQILQQLNITANRFLSIEWSPDSTRVVSKRGDHIVRVWNATTGDRTHKLIGHTKSVQAASWSPDGTRLATASNDCTLRIWKINGSV